MSPVTLRQTLLGIPVVHGLGPGTLKPKVRPGPIHLSLPCLCTHLVSRGQAFPLFRLTWLEGSPAPKRAGAIPPTGLPPLS